MNHKEIYFEGLRHEIRHHMTTGGANQRWAVAERQRNIFVGDLIAGGPLDAPVDVVNIGIELNLVSSAHGFHDFDVTGHPDVHRVCIGFGIKKGDVFNVYGPGSSKRGAFWMESVEKSLANFLDLNPASVWRKSEPKMEFTKDSETSREVHIAFSPPVTEDNFYQAFHVAHKLANAAAKVHRTVVINFMAQDVPVQVIDSDTLEEVFSLWNRKAISAKLKASKAISVDALIAQADAELSQYEFGDDIMIAGADGWDTSDVMDLTKIVYITGSDDPPDADSQKVSFHVVFNSVGGVEGAYGLLGRSGAHIGSRATSQSEMEALADTWSSQR